MTSGGRQVTYGSLLRLCYDAFMLGLDHVVLPTGSYPVTRDVRGSQVIVGTEDGPLRVYMEEPGRETAAQRMAQAEPVLRVSLNGRVFLFGLVDGEFTENVEGMCAAIIMA